MWGLLTHESVKWLRWVWNNSRHTCSWTSCAATVRWGLMGGDLTTIVGPTTPMQSSLSCGVGTALLRLMIGSQSANTDCGAAKVVPDMLKAKVMDGGIQSAWLDLDRVGVNRLCLIWISCHRALICEIFINSQGLIMSDFELLLFVVRIMACLRFWNKFFL